MSSCSPSASVCGTGIDAPIGPGDPGWPEDPNTGSIRLTAVGQPGGIGVRWNYPALNAHSIAHTIIYRGRSDSFSGAAELVYASGNYFFDQDSDKQPTRWYYWIKTVSISGTESGLIGPAYATAISTIDGIIKDLTGEIDAGVLATELRKDIERINLIDMQLIREAAARLSDNAVLMQALADVDAGIAAAQTFILDESFQRVTNDEALASRISLMASALDAGLASVVDITNTAVTNLDGKITVQADRTTQLSSKLEGDLATATTQIETKITKVGDDVKAATTKVDQLAITTGSELSAAENRLNININRVDNRVTQQASAITSVESSANTNLAQAEQRLTTNITTVDNKVTAIGSMYTMKLSANGLIGGFGVYNNGSTVEAGFDVDKFWIGRTHSDKKKPFIIHNGIVYMNNAMIADLSVDRLKINSYPFTNGSAYMSNGTTGDVRINHYLGRNVLPVILWNTPPRERTSITITYEDPYSFAFRMNAFDATGVGYTGTVSYQFMYL